MFVGFSFSKSVFVSFVVALGAFALLLSCHSILVSLSLIFKQSLHLLLSNLKHGLCETRYRVLIDCCQYSFWFIASYLQPKSNCLRLQHLMTWNIAYFIWRFLSISISITTHAIAKLLKASFIDGLESYVEKTETMGISMC